MASIEALVKQRLKEFDARGAEEEKIAYLLEAAPYLKEFDAIVEDTGAETLHTPGDPSNMPLENFITMTDGSHSKRREVLVRYLEEVEHIPVDVGKLGSHFEPACSECGGRLVTCQDQSSLVCTQCGLTKQYLEEGTRGLSYDEEVSRATKTQFSYKRLTHLVQWIDSLQAKENTTIPDDVVDAVRNEFRKHRLTSKSDITPQRVKTFLKKLNLSRWYEHINHIVNLINGAPAVRLPQELEERLKVMFLTIQRPFETHRPKNRKNFFSYAYVLYKLCQLLGEDQYLPLFPLLKSVEKLRAQDDIWKKICAELQWEYIPTV
jgi:hypothetical protein